MTTITTSAILLHRIGIGSCLFQKMYDSAQQPLLVLISHAKAPVKLFPCAFTITHDKFRKRPKQYYIRYKRNLSCVAPTCCAGVCTIAVYAIQMRETRVVVHPHKMLQTTTTSCTRILQNRRKNPSVLGAERTNGGKSRRKCGRER